MIFTETELKGAFIIEPEKLQDHRGFFARAWCKNEFEAHGLNASREQSNISFNLKKCTLRGMHYQISPFEEVKLVRCTRGAIFDVIIDLRPDSPTFLKWFGIELNLDNYKMLYVPENFAHGYLTLTDNAEVYYQVSKPYSPDHERGLRWNDPVLGVNWPIGGEPLISDKDKNWPSFKL
jgi:dTDP-4-dehydrorhamnose 3,5-epimerase